MTARICTEPGCDRTVKGRGLCSTHYSAWWRDGGETEHAITLDVAPLARLLAQVNRPLELILDPGDRRALYRALNRGTISDLVADRVATYVLGMQLDVIYGPDWDAEGVAA